MDPITAWALALKAIADLFLEIVKRQPPEVAAKMWEQWFADQEFWRNLFHRTVDKKP